MYRLTRRGLMAAGAAPAVMAAWPARADATPPTIEALIQKPLARADVDYIHVRSTKAGCYTFRIERASSTPAGQGEGNCSGKL